MKKGTCNADILHAQFECNMKCNECSKFEQEIIKDYNRTFKAFRLFVWFFIYGALIVAAFVLGFKLISYIF